MSFMLLALIAGYDVPHLVRKPRRRAVGAGRVGSALTRVRCHGGPAPACKHVAAISGGRGFVKGNAQWHGRPRARVIAKAPPSSTVKVINEFPGTNFPAGDARSIG
jgi:hypothetical protein